MYVDENGAVDFMFFHQKMRNLFQAITINMIKGAKQY